MTWLRFEPHTSHKSTSTCLVASSNDRISEFEKMWKEMTQLEVLSEHLSGKTEERHRKPKSGYSPSTMSFDLGTSQIQVRNTTIWATFRTEESEVLVRGSIKVVIFRDVMLCKVSYIGIDVLKEPAASTLNPEDGNSMILRNTGNHLSDYRVS